MPWIKFERDYDWFPQALKRVSHVAFRRGMVIFATREAANETMVKGAAREATEEEIERARGRA